MALGAVAFRLIEGVFYSLAAVATMVLVSLSGQLAGTFLGLVSGLLVLFQAIGVLSGTQVVLNLPIAAQEMVLAVWLIVKGLSPKAKPPAPEPTAAELTSA
jgi:thiamine transporter ThiT